MYGFRYQIEIWTQPHAVFRGVLYFNGDFPFAEAKRYIFTVSPLAKGQCKYVNIDASERHGDRSLQSQGDCGTIISF
jgi:hypothetical protein